METGAFGWKFQDQIQPILDDYDRRINDIRLNGVEGQLARMQAVGDAMANSAREAEMLNVPYGVARQPDQALFSASDPVGTLGAPTTNSDGGQFGNAGFRIGAGNDGFLDRASLRQLGPVGPGSAVFLGTRNQPKGKSLGSGSPQNPHGRIAGVAGGNTDSSETLSAYANNPVVAAALDSAWSRSTGKYIDQRREINAFGRQNSKGDIWVEPASSQYSDSNINVRLPPPDSGLLGKAADWLLGNKTIFEIHTHPNPGDFQMTGPSDDDKRVSQSTRVPLIVQSTDGIHFYDPAQHK